MTRHIALLRGINVGGKNKLAMNELVALCEGVGATDVDTYIQSGNVVFNAPDALLAGFADALRAALKKKHKLDVPVVVRAGTELDEIVARNPFSRSGGDTDALHVGFLSSVPPVARVQGLDATRGGNDRFRVVGAHVFLSLPGGMARTRLTNSWFDRTLETTSTFRNWKSVLAIRALARSSVDD